MSERARYPIFAAGDLNAFFGLMLDNVTNLVLLTGILTGVFGFPREFIFTHMIPGTALGVMVGDLIYTWMAFRLARKTGRRDVTAMPLGLDTPSTIGIAFAVLGPTYLASGDAMVTWQVGMATMVFMGIVKLGLSFAGEWIRSLVPQAGLLGSLAGVGIALLGMLPLIHIFNLPLVGLVAFGLVLYALVARLELPGKLPGAAVAVLGATAVYYVLGLAGIGGQGDSGWHLSLHVAPPVPTLGFVDGLMPAIRYLPVAIPFGLLTIVGGINVTESARVAGDDYRTRDILLTEAVATLVAGVTGGVAQSTPYIGHPAYKAMGGRAGYTLATGLFIGLGGVFGYVSFIVDALPAAAVAPILIFVGLEIVSQTFATCPKSHFPAIALAILPAVANLTMIKSGQMFGDLQGAFARLQVEVPGLAERALTLSPDVAEDRLVVTALGNGFILTAMLWGGFGAFLADRKLLHAAVFLGICALFAAFGVIHSIDPAGSLYLPGTTETSLPVRIATGYAAFALILVGLHALRRRAAWAADPGGRCAAGGRRSESAR
jgi:AGZA family xanthine/uracil permease-like MFS transporter